MVNRPLSHVERIYSGNYCSIKVFVNLRKIGTRKIVSTHTYLTTGFTVKTQIQIKTEFLKIQNGTDLFQYYTGE